MMYSVRLASAPASTPAFFSSKRGRIDEHLRDRAAVDVHLLIRLAVDLHIDHVGGNAPGMAAEATMMSWNSSRLSGAARGDLASCSR